MNIVKIWLLSLTICLSISACTITPDEVRGQALVTDSEGGVNGFYGWVWIDGKRCALYTDAGREIYGNLVPVYAVQFQKKYGVTLSKNDMIYYKGFWKLDEPHATYYGVVKGWARNNREVDK